MKPRILVRKLHHWSAPLILLPVGVVICTGLLLIVKKEFEWIQPATQVGTRPAEPPKQSLQQLFDAARQAPELELGDWADLTRVDVKPKQGIVKFVARNRWEAQIDAYSGEVLQVAYRRSDLIESLHDGSFFAPWTKSYIFLPSGLVLLMLWGSGIYLFVITRVARRRKAQRKQQRLESSLSPSAQ